MPRPDCSLTGSVPELTFYYQLAPSFPIRKHDGPGGRQAQRIHTGHDVVTFVPILTLARLTHSNGVNPGPSLRFVTNYLIVSIDLLSNDCPSLTSLRIIFLNFFSLKCQLKIVTRVLRINPPANTIQKKTVPKTIRKNNNRKIERISVQIKVPTMIYNK